jgi:FAD/FMN-containing dehydrogenase
VLRVLNAHRIPAWTCSRGKNLGYGGPAPVVEGSLVLSLHRMSKIIEVNEREAYAIVEPGVTFRDLSEYCLAHKPNVWPNVPSIGWGSVVGNVRIPRAPCKRD